MTTIFEAMNAFLNAGEADGLRANTRTWYQAILKSFGARFGASEVGSVTPDQLRTFVIEIRRKAKSEVTAADRITALHRFWAWSSGEYAVPNPMARIKRPKRPDPLPKAPTIEHVRTLLAACKITSRSGVRDLALLTVVLDTCIRIDEALALTPEDIDFANRQILIRRGKGGKSRVVPFTRECEQVLTRWLKYRPLDAEHVFVSVTQQNAGKRLSYAGARQILRRLHKAAGLDVFFSWHKYRHFGAQQYRLQGGDPLNLQKLLGHADVGTTFKHYGNHKDAELVEQHEHFSALNVLHEQEGI